MGLLAVAGIDARVSSESLDGARIGYLSLRGEPFTLENPRPG